ncbi:MAG: D-glycero-beta-D-manno-heptose 1-phosphate adenylyltransferase [Candidatus Kapabacteria bacterium]|nr:D-glycero-beta-D-manno-heptose 1-phosphate adenylyltransferase [Candidatus Kapabacteria bacterium]
MLSSLDELELLRGTLRAQGKRIVFTNGVFDILHAGHVTYLEQARAFGDVLVLGLNADESVRRLKGPDRPVNAEADRALVVAALRSVDHVMIFGDDTPLTIIEALLPDVLVKGGDYTRDTIVGADVVEANGGTVHTIPLLEGRSTSSVINRVRTA